MCVMKIMSQATASAVKIAWRPSAPGHVYSVYSVYSDVKVPKPICTLTPNDVLAQVYMSLHVYQTLSTSFYNLHKPHLIGRPPAIHSSNRVKTGPAPPFARC